MQLDMNVDCGCEEMDLVDVNVGICSLGEERTVSRRRRVRRKKFASTPVAVVILLSMLSVGEEDESASRREHPGYGLTWLLTELFSFFFRRPFWVAWPEHGVKLFACFQPSNLTVISLLIVGRASRAGWSRARGHSLLARPRRVQSYREVRHSEKCKRVVLRTGGIAGSLYTGAGHNAVIYDMAEIRL